MGKPKFTITQMCTALRETKGMVTLAATRLGCDYNTVIAYINKHDACRQARDEAREQMGDAAELKLYSKAVQDGDTTALIFLLKTQFKKRGYVERSEQVTYNVDAELLKRTIDRIEQAGMSASDVFNNILAEIDRASVSANGGDEK